MKRIETSNRELLQVLTDNGISIICNNDMQMIVSDEDASKIDNIVSRLAPAATYDYVLTDIKKKYIVYYNDEVNEPADVFTADTLEECKQWIAKNVEGLTPVDEEHYCTDDVSRSTKVFFYEVYDKPIVETNGSEYASDWVYSVAVYSSDYYYRD